MGWPRKNDVMRLYADKKEKGAYFLLLVANGIDRSGYDAIVNVYSGSTPSLCGGSISPNYLAATWAKRTQWDELPAEWQEAFRSYMDSDPDDPFIPENIRGFWRIGRYHPIPVTQSV